MRTIRISKFRASLYGLDRTAFKLNHFHACYLTSFSIKFIQHQIHHCGQAHAMLAGTSIAPPQLDEFFCANEADLREDDFRELGFSKSEIWKHSSASTLS